MSSLTVHTKAGKTLTYEYEYATDYLQNTVLVLTKKDGSRVKLYYDCLEVLDFTADKEATSDDET